MSILLEALKKKNQTAAREQAPQEPQNIDPTGRDETVVDEAIASEVTSVAELAQAMAIQPPPDLAPWQLSHAPQQQAANAVQPRQQPDATDQPLLSLTQADQREMDQSNSLLNSTTEPEPIVDKPALAFDLILPTAPPEETPHNSENELMASSPREESMASSEFLDATPVLESTITATIADERSQQTANDDAHTDKEALSQTETIPEVAHESVLTLASVTDESAKVSTESASQEDIAARIEKTPQSAQKFLNFARRLNDKIAKMPPGNKQNTAQAAEALTPQPFQYTKISSNRPLLLVGGALVGLGTLTYVALSIWESQQQAYEQQIARYKNLNLTNLPTQPQVSTAPATTPTQASIADHTSVDTSAKQIATPSTSVVSETPLTHEVTNVAATETSTQQTQTATHTDAPATTNQTPSSNKASHSAVNTTQISQAHVLDTNRTKTQHRASTSVSKGPSAAEAGDGQVSLVQTQSTAALLSDAYQAWQHGQVVQAEQIYRQILEKQPQQRDALLGMLAVSQINGSSADIIRSYAERLHQYYPADREVRLAINAIMPSSASDRLDETTLKLSQQQGDTAEASYQLGLVYAEQQRWTEAQAAFFEAVQRAPKQADYRLNLAISYDHLGKGQLALEHYQAALSTANQSYSIDQAAIEQRIAYLQQTLGLTP